MKEANIIFASMPIGDFEDKTYNLVKQIEKADIVICETYAFFKDFLSINNITTNAKIIGFEKFNKYSDYEKKIHVELIEDYILNQYKNKRILIVSDEGSSQIIDPFFNLNKKLIDKNINYSVIPGPSAVINAICNSGFRTDSFIFLGEYESTPKDRKENLLNLIKTNNISSVCFVSFDHLKDFFESYLKHLEKNRKICICINMTDFNEQIIRGTLEELYLWSSNNFNNINYSNFDKFAIIIDGMRKTDFTRKI